MASDEPAHSKRPHVRTERMQEFLRSQEESSSPQKHHPCPKCQKNFTSMPGLKYHMKKHDPSIDQQFLCVRCQKVFQSANGLKYHSEKTRCGDQNAFISSQKGECRGHEEEGSVIGVHSTDDLQKRRVLPPPLDLSTHSSQANQELGSNALKWSQEGCVLNRGQVETGVGMDKLTELAIIATSPQSPLLQKQLSPWESRPGDLHIVKRSLEESFEKCESGANGNIKNESAIPASDSNGNYVHDGSDPRVSTSSPLLSSEDISPSSETWSHSWPTAVWQCFIKGTQVKFSEGNNTSWQKVETLAVKDSIAQQASLEGDKGQESYAPEGLRVVKISSHCEDQSSIEIVFSPDDVEQSQLTVDCTADHPFFVKNKGWSSFDPQWTIEHYGIPCNELSVSDVCLPPGHRDAAYSSDVFKRIESFDFTPEDTSAVFALSSMKQRKDSDLSPQSKAGNKKLSGKPEPLKAKRPMNAFMLFAKEFRMEYTNQYPGKDNRAISVMLGEKWKALSYAEKLLYEDKARVLAEEQKKIHPDCWKRKK